MYTIFGHGVVSIVPNLLRHAYGISVYTVSSESPPPYSCRGNFTLLRTVLRIRKFTFLEDTFLFIDLSYTQFVHMPRGMVYTKGSCKKMHFQYYAYGQYGTWYVQSCSDSDCVPSTTLYEKRTRWRSRWLTNTLMLIKSWKNTKVHLSWKYDSSSQYFEIFQVLDSYHKYIKPAQLGQSTRHEQPMARLWYFH